MLFFLFLFFYIIAYTFAILKSGNLGDLGLNNPWSIQEELRLFCDNHFGMLGMVLVACDTRATLYSFSIYILRLWMKLSCWIELGGMEGQKGCWVAYMMEWGL